MGFRLAHEGKKGVSLGCAMNSWEQAHPSNDVLFIQVGSDGVDNNYWQVHPSCAAFKQI